MEKHRTVLLDRPVVDGRPRYQVLCSCGQRTSVGSRATAEQEQKDHRRAVRRRPTLYGDVGQATTDITGPEADALDQELRGEGDNDPNS